MNTSNPFDSHGQAHAQVNQSRNRLRLAVFAAFGISILVLIPLLVQGCKRQEEPAPVTDTSMPPFVEDTNTLPPDLSDTNLVLPPFAPADTNVMTPVAPLPVGTPDLAAPAPVGGTEYTVVKGDSFYTIGKKFGVSTKAMQDANPGVDSTHLKIGQKLHVPAPTASAASAVAPMATSGNTYTVKSGDTLLRIAKHFGTSVKAIKSENNLATDKIKVGQKLKIPVKETAPVAVPAVEPVITPVPVLPPPIMAPTNTIN